MGSYNLAEAKAHLSEIVERAAAGEEIEITKRGRPMVRLVSARSKQPKIDMAAIRAFTAGLKKHRDDVDFVQQMRDEDRY